MTSSDTGHMDNMETSGLKDHVVRNLGRLGRLRP
jgi:hypothetical protein